MVNSANMEGSRSIKEAFGLNAHENLWATGKVLNITTAGLVKSDSNVGLHTNTAEMSTASKVARVATAIILAIPSILFLAPAMAVDAVRYVINSFKPSSTDAQVNRGVNSILKITKDAENMQQLQYNVAQELLKVKDPSDTTVVSGPTSYKATQIIKTLDNLAKTMISLQKESGKSDVETLKAVRQFMQVQKVRDVAGENRLAYNMIEQGLMLSLSNALIENHLWENFGNITKEEFTSYVDSLKEVSPHLNDLNATNIRNAFINRSDVIIQRDKMISKLKGKLENIVDPNNISSDFKAILKTARKNLSINKINELRDDVDQLRDYKKAKADVREARNIPGVSLDTGSIETQELLKGQYESHNKALDTLNRLNDQITALEEKIPASKKDFSIAYGVLTNKDRAMSALMRNKQRAYIKTLEKLENLGKSHGQFIQLETTLPELSEFREDLEKVYENNSAKNNEIIEHIESKLSREEMHEFLGASKTFSESTMGTLKAAPSFVTGLIGKGFNAFLNTANNA